MARVIITFRIMPKSPESDLAKIEASAKKKIENFGGAIMRSEIQAVAFGLKSVNLTFSLDEKKGSTEPLEADINKIAEVQSCEVIAISRAFG